MKTGVAAGVLALLAFASPCEAQMVAPDIEVQSLTDKKHPHIEEDESVVGTDAELSRLRGRGAGYEDIAVIKIVFKGKWYQSADSMAQAKAAPLGANFLVLKQSQGKEEWGAGTVRIYRAVRLTDPGGAPTYIRASNEAAPTQPAQQTPPLQPVTAPSISPAAETPPEPPAEHRHFRWVWEEGSYQLSHRIIFDPARASAADRTELEHYVRRNFSREELDKLRKALKRRSVLAIDLKLKVLNERAAP